MAHLKIEEVVDQLESEFRKALQATCRAHFPGQEFNARAVYKTFKKQIASKCDEWENIPNKYVRA